MTFNIRPIRTQTHSFDRFEVVAEELGLYTIEVSLPPGNVAKGEKYPSILATDGNFLFDLTQTLVHGGWANMVGLLPPSIVVGMGYPADEGMASYYARGNFDFYGTWDMTDPVGQLMQGWFGSLKNAERKHDMVMRAGGVERFVGFLRDELLPTVAKHYPVDPKARHTLIGDSSGGHFVLRAYINLIVRSRAMSVSAPPLLAQRARLKLPKRPTPRRTMIWMPIFSSAAAMANSGARCTRYAESGAEWPGSPSSSRFAIGRTLASIGKS